MIKRLILLYCILAFMADSYCQTSSQEIRWLDWSEAEKALHAKAKPVFLYLYAPWCEPCKRMEQTTLKDTAIIRQIQKHYIPVRFDAESRDLIIWNEEDYAFEFARGRIIHSLALKYMQGLPVYPSFALIGHDRTTIGMFNGVQPTDRLLHLLHFPFQQSKIPWDEWISKESSSSKGSE